MLESQDTESPDGAPEHQIRGALLVMLFVAHMCACNSKVPSGLADVPTGSLLREGIRIPPELLLPDLSKVTLRLECVGVRTVQDLPDGWSVSASAVSEDYLVTFSPGTNTTSRAALGSARIQLRWRGWGSDCFGTSAIAHLKGSQHPTRMCFQLAFPGGEWSPIDCAGVDARWHANAPKPESARSPGDADARPADSAAP